MTIKQLSIFIENKGGTLVKVLDTLSKGGIQIIASTIADTKDYGIYRVLCDKPTQAFIMLAEAVEAISEAGVSILYMYSFLWKGKGTLVMRTDPVERAKEIITIKKLTFLTETDFE